MAVSTKSTVFFKVIP